MRLAPNQISISALYYTSSCSPTPSDYIPAVSLACFGEPPGALAAGCAVPSDEAWGNAAEAAGLSDGGPQGEPVGAVRAVGAAPRPRLAVPWQRFRL